MCARTTAVRAAAILSLAVGAQQADANQTELASVNSAEQQGDFFSSECVPSGDGRYVAFTSYASNLVPQDRNDTADVFRRDRISGVTVLISATPNGKSGNEASGGARIAPGGRFVAFSSDSTDLVSPPSPIGTSMFLRDVQKGKTLRFPPTVDSRPVDSFIQGPFAISKGGRYISFDSPASNLVRRETNHFSDAFLYDSYTDRVIRVSVGPNGPANSDSFGGAMSSDGRFVAFGSLATNLVPGDTNDEADVFVRDRKLGTVVRASLGGNGEQGNDSSGGAAISDDGRFVAFTSQATNLVPGDTPHTDDLFLRDLKAKTTINLTPGDARAKSVFSISTNGRFITLSSDEALVPADTNFATDAYIYDRINKTYALLSIGSGGQLSNGFSGSPVISSNGAAVAFVSDASNLVPRDLNGYSDCFLRLR